MYVYERKHYKHLGFRRHTDMTNMLEYWCSRHTKHVSRFARRLSRFPDCARPARLIVGWLAEGVVYNLDSFYLAIV